MVWVWLLFLSWACHGIAVVPLSEGRVSQSRDHNIVALKSGWHKIDFDKQYQHGRPPPPFDDKHTRSDTSIVVLIAALRETRLADTLVSLFSNAQHPNRVFVGVVQQNAPEDEDVVVEYCRKMGTPVQLNGTLLQQPHDCVWADHIRMHRMLASEAAGPVYARAIGNTLVHFDQDDFCLQIDAHTVVVKGWDTLILEDWGKANNEFAVLTTYPTNAKDLGQSTAGHWEMPHLCSLDGSRGVFMNSQAKACANLDAPLLGVLWAAGLSFSKCHAERLVPNDINLKGIFVGEEYSRGVRLWTHGYDFYSNSRPFIGTYYGGEKGGKSHSWKTGEIDNSHTRLRILSKVPGYDTPEQMESLGRYQLGKQRTLEQYIEFTGIDPRGTPDHAKFVCAPVYVPWYTPPFVVAKEDRQLRSNPSNDNGGGDKGAMVVFGGLGATFLFAVIAKLLRDSRKPRTD
ncbi:hypothetical protein BASA81_002716 [Batrachochytrium salamandrivorans]|nr:hypothetical protein BASA81_002716 [Batrachochytrium salamandrivorans]